MLNVGLLGAGRIGQVHAVNIAGHPESRLAAVSDVNADAAKAIGAKFGADVRTSDEIIADSGIDAVLIATSTDTHSDLIEAAAAAGKAILCEKPVDLSLARAEACLGAVRESGVPVMIGFNRRFDPSFAALKAALDDGEIGKGELLSITSFDPGPPPMEYVRVSGGLFRDMMIHDFDLACWIMGAPPETVTAKASSIVDPAIGQEGDVDTAVVTLTWPDGRLGVIRNSRRAAYGYDQRLEILGEKGLLDVSNVAENRMRRATADGVTSAKPMHFFLERYMPAYAREWMAFVTSVAENDTPPVTLEEGIDALAVAEAATQSAKSGETVRVANVRGA